MKKNLWPTTAAYLLLQLCLGAIYLFAALRFDVAAVLVPEQANTAGLFVPGVMLIFLAVGSLLSGFLPLSAMQTGLLGTVLFALGLALSGLVKSMGLLYLTYGVLSGLGMGLVLRASAQSLSKAHAPLLSAASFGVSVLVFVPVARLLLRAHTGAQGAASLRPVFLILAVLFAVPGIVGCLLLPRKKQRDSLPTAARHPLFLPLFLSLFLLSGAWGVCLPRWMDLTMARELSQTIALFSICLAGIAAALGHYAAVSLTRSLGPFLPLYFLSGVTVICGILLTFAGSYGCCAAMVLVSFAFGGCLPPMRRLYRMLLGNARETENIAFLLFAPGLSCLIFQWIARLGLAAAFVLSALSALIAVYVLLRLNYALDVRKAAKA